MWCGVIACCHWSNQDRCLSGAVTLWVKLAILISLVEATASDRLWSSIWSTERGPIFLQLQNFWKSYTFLLGYLVMHVVCEDNSRQWMVAFVWMLICYYCITEADVVIGIDNCKMQLAVACFHDCPTYGMTSFLKFTMCRGGVWTLFTRNSGGSPGLKAIFTQLDEAQATLTGQKTDDLLVVID